MENKEIPSLVPIAFKEWSTVCAAIAAGRQQIILRKGGIAEGRTGFCFEHDRFFLFPTLFHQQSAGVREHFGSADLPVTDTLIPLRYFVEVLWKGELEQWEAVQALEPLHIWKREVVRDRFLYRDAAAAGDDEGGSAGDGEPRGRVQLAVIQAWDLGDTWWLPFQRRYGGCRSWVDLPEIPEKFSCARLQKITDGDRFPELVGVLGKIGVMLGGEC